MGKRETYIGHCWQRQKERDHNEEQGVHEWIILTWIMERNDGVVWTGLAWLRIRTSGELLSMWQ
jgi:hypothetical protein